MNYYQERQIRESMVEVCHRMWQKNFISATDGNVSTRLDSHRILMTPSGVGKGFLKPDDLIVTDIKGNQYLGHGLPTTEIWMHLATYEERPDIHSIVHAHPPYAVAFSIAGEEIPANVLPEVVVHLSRIPVVPYATPGTQEAGNAIRPYVRQYDAFIMEKHGSVTVGKDVFEAYYKLEKLENAAHVVYLARQLGRVQALSEAQIQALLVHHQHH